MLAGNEGGRSEFTHDSAESTRSNGARDTVENLLVSNLELDVLEAKFDTSLACCDASNRVQGLRDAARACASVLFCIILFLVFTIATMTIAIGHSLVCCCCWLACVALCHAIAIRCNNGVTSGRIDFGVVSTIGLSICNNSNICWLRVHFSTNSNIACSCCGSHCQKLSRWSVS